ncbi:MAG: electron transfer flavoprotein subunit beta/FixA family protein [Pseudomonadota bacterium]
MNVVVCVKQVPDTESVIKVKPDGSNIIQDGLKFVMNPYDEYGIEEALQIKEKLGGLVTILCMGPGRAVETIRTGLAMGADQAVQLDDPAFEGGDAFATAKALAEALKGMEYDLIFCGKQAIDDDLSQVGSCLAELLNLPQVSLIQKLVIADDKKSATVNRQVEGGIEVLKVSLPAVLTTQKGLNEPRYASLPGIMKAKKKPLDVKNLAALGLGSDSVGSAGSKLKIKKYTPPPARAAGKIIEGEGPQETVPKLVKLLREEAKMI